MSQAQKSRLMGWGMAFAMSLALVSIALLLADPGRQAMADAGGGGCAGASGGGPGDCIECTENGPHYDPWTCDQDADVTLGSVTPTGFLCKCIGDSVSASAAGPNVTSGDKSRTVTYDCDVDDTETGTVSPDTSNTTWSASAASPSPASGGGLSASFTAGASGTGTITFKVHPTTQTPSGCVNSLDTATKDYTVIEVGDFSVAGAVEIPDPNPSGSDPPGTKAYGVLMAASGDVTVTAATVPSVAEANLPSCWTLTGGSGSGKLQRTVSMASSGTTIITATAGTTTKRVKIYVFDVTVTAKKVPDLPSEFSESGATIAAGGLNTGIHQAHVKVAADPAFGPNNIIKVTLGGSGAGYSSGIWWWGISAIPATYSVDGNTLTFGDTTPIQLTSVNVVGKSGTVTSSNREESITVKFEVVDLGVTKSIGVDFSGGAFEVDLGNDPLEKDEWRDMTITRKLDTYAIDKHKLRIAVTTVTLLDDTVVEAEANSLSDITTLDSYVSLSSDTINETASSNPGATVQVKVLDPLVKTFEIGVGDMSYATGN